MRNRLLPAKIDIIIEIIKITDKIGTFGMNTARLEMHITSTNLVRGSSF
jgi:hypothetical protein